MRKKIEGTVKVKVQIGSNGKVTNASIYASSGQGDFDSSALRAAKKWRYKPAYNGLGQPVASSKVETVMFKLR